jgi:DNA-binding MarR family transcriptional regulator
MDLTQPIWKLILQESIDALRTEVDKDMPLSAILILLAMPNKGKISFREVERITNVPHATCSRGLSLLAGYAKYRVTGLTPLVAFSDDEMDRRSRFAELTPEGHAKVDKVYNIVSSRLARATQSK